MHFWLMHLQVGELGKLIAATRRDHPIPKIHERKLKQMEKEAAKAAAIAEQEREAAALAQLAPVVAAALEGQTQQTLQQQKQDSIAVAQLEPVVAVAGQHETAIAVALDEPASKRHCAEAAVHVAAANTAAAVQGT